MTIKGILRRLFHSDSEYLGHYQRPGWSGPLPFYLFRCETHGFVVDYPHGHYERLICPICTVDLSPIEKPRIRHLKLEVTP